MIPDRERANKELKWVADLNPGPWKEHPLYVAAACESVAPRYSHMDRNRAYVLGPLRNTGRYTGRTSERHLLDGYRRYMEHGWEETARICMNHASMIQGIGTPTDEFDVTPQDCEFMKEFVPRAVHDDYDRLVQLCDSLALPTGFCPLETRFVGVTIRYGVHPSTIPRWKRVLEAKDYLEEQMECTIYEALSCGGRLQHL